MSGRSMEPVEGSCAGNRGVKMSDSKELSELKVVVKHDMPRDELWVHPVMFDLLQRLLMEADTMRGFRPDYLTHLA
jgi:hypothetical protein